MIMRCFNYDISEDVIKLSVSELSGVFTVYQLKKQLEINGVPVYLPYNYISINVASRVIQKMKKENKIEKIYGGGGNTLWKKKTRNKKTKANGNTITRREERL